MITKFLLILLGYSLSYGQSGLSLTQMNNLDGSQSKLN